MGEKKNLVLEHHKRMVCQQGPVSLTLWADVISMKVAFLEVKLSKELIIGLNGGFERGCQKP